MKRERGASKWKLGNLAFLAVGFKCLQVCLILVSREQSFSNNKHSALIRIIHKIHKIIHMLAWHFQSEVAEQWQFPDNYWSLENPVVYDDIMDVAVGPEGEAVRDSWRSSSHNPVITTLITDKNT